MTETSPASRPRVHTSTRPGSRFTVVDPAPTLEEFLAGEPAYNPYGLELKLITPTDTNGAELNGATAICVAGNWMNGQFAPVGHGTTYPEVHGSYHGVGSDLTLVL